jgi:hypothetical protein
VNQGKRFKAYVKNWFARLMYSSTNNDPNITILKIKKMNKNAPAPTPKQDIKYNVCINKKGPRQRIILKTFSYNIKSRQKLIKNSTFSLPIDGQSFNDQDYNNACTVCSQEADMM